MRKPVAVVVVLTGCLCKLALGNTAYSCVSCTAYTDVWSWLTPAIESTPATTVFEERFNSGSVDVPGLSVQSMNRLDGQLGSGRASIQNGAWVEAGWKGDYTLVTFDAPIYAFGADWKMKVDSGLLLFTNGGPVAAFPINLSGDQIYRGLTYNGFFGFVSELPFTQVVIESGSACNAERASRASCYDVADDAQAFTMENLVITVAPQAATAPEPGTVGLVGLTLAAIAVLLRSRFPSNCARKTT